MPLQLVYLENAVRRSHGVTHDNNCNVVERGGPPKTSKRGRVKKLIRGRPKTSQLSAEDQQKIAVTNYAKRDPDMNRKAVAKYNEEHIKMGDATRAKYKKKHSNWNRFELGTKKHITLLNNNKI